MEIKTSTAVFHNSRIRMRDKHWIFLNHVIVAKWELHFPEFPLLVFIHLGSAIKEVGPGHESTSGKAGGMSGW